MPNNYFQFKEFRIEQEHCSMKVCTDACIFGAFVAMDLRDRVSERTLVLDIGSGTGLLSLMIAQKIQAVIDAVEIEGAACRQAGFNFDASPWKDRLNIFNTDIINFRPGKKYDHIISNPPFYEEDLRSDNEGKNRAKHDLSLTLVDLLKVVNELLKGEGTLWVLLPYHRVGLFENEAGAMGFHTNHKIIIRHTTTHPYFRGILALSKNKTAHTNKEFIIKTGNDVYTEAFIELLGDYYLNL